MRIGLGEKNPFDEVEAQTFEKSEEEVIKGLNILILTVIVSIIAFCIFFSIILFCKIKKRKIILNSQSQNDFCVDAESLASS